MRAISLMVGIFLVLIIIFVIIWFMTAERAGNAEALLPEYSIEYVAADGEAIYEQMFI